MFSLSSRHTDRPRWARRIVLLVLLLAIPFLLASPKPMTASMVADSENGTKVLILNYHKIDDTFIALAVRPEDFDAQMKYLSEHGYHTITPDELYDSSARQLRGQLQERIPHPQEVRFQGDDFRHLELPRRLPELHHLGPGARNGCGQHLHPVAHRRSQVHDRPLG